jgi:RND family efflux transporter MFP subunit
MQSGVSKIVALSLLLVAAMLTGWILFGTYSKRDSSGGRERSRGPVPVEVALIEREPIALQRTFSGELESLAEFVVAPKVSGRVEHVLVDIADTVTRGQVVAELDNDEYVQAVAQARADLLVAGANLFEARSALEIANREFKRAESLLRRKIVSESDFDSARQDLLVKQAQLKVAEAQAKKAESSLETSNIRLGYTQVTAGWTGGDDHRIVAERYVDEGQTVAANTPLLLIVELDPIIGIVFVTERDYAHLKPGQAVTLTTDAYPEEQYTGQVTRIAPVFRKSTRQARVEITIENTRHQLKPGMFIIATVVLARVSDATIVPERALTVRDDRNGIFVLSEDGRKAIWRPVSVGIRDGDRVQVIGEGLTGRVVTLGQQLVDDGSAVSISNGQDLSGAGSEKANAQ